MAYKVADQIRDVGLERFSYGPWHGKWDQPDEHWIGSIYVNTLPDMEAYIFDCITGCVGGVTLDDVEMFVSSRNTLSITRLNRYLKQLLPIIMQIRSVRREMQFVFNKSERWAWAAKPKKKTSTQ